ncbi:MAG: HEPN domain-containing protein [Planctomycetota bacterium]|nr:HEPN domain-containing protein [Planctomycetota bacterium]
MNSTVKEWVDKAQADFAMAGREMRAGRRRSNDGIYFHAQPCIEKLMKAILTDRGDVPPGKTQGVRNLLSAIRHGPTWP